MEEQDTYREPDADRSREISRLKFSSVELDQQGRLAHATVAQEDCLERKRGGEKRE